MAKNDNLKDFLTDVADAIRAKEGSTGLINPQEFSERIRSIETGGGASSEGNVYGYTGNADVEGLKAIGWDDDDIAFFQMYGVDWDAEFDEFHKVPDNNRALYGILTTIDDVANYKDILQYLPKIDTAGVNSFYLKFDDCKLLKAIPNLDTDNVTSLSYAFRNCHSLTALPLKFKNTLVIVNDAFNGCYSLRKVNIDIIDNPMRVFQENRSLDSVKVKVSGICTNLLDKCYTLSNAEIDMTGCTNADNMFDYCYCLKNAFLFGLGCNVNLKQSEIISKEAILYTINNSSSNVLTIKLASNVYTQLTNDVDIVSALAQHTNVSLIS